MFSEETKEKYIRNKGQYCPFCGSGNIDSDNLDADGDEVRGSVVCDSCGKEWKDLFKLVDVLEENE